MENRKRRFLSFSLAFILTTTIINDRLKNKSDTIYIDESIDNPHYIGSCDIGDVYLGTKEEIECLELSNIDGILIVDERDAKDPNIQIIDSYNISTTSSMKDVLKIVKNYDEKNPSKWSRTIKSMINEWWIHNLCFIHDYYCGNTRDVDLNNADEEIFKTFDIKKLLLKKQKLDK